VAYVVAAFVLTNFTVAASLPLILPVVLGHPTPDAFAKVARTVGGVFFAPFAAAWLVRRIHPEARTWPSKLGNVTFSMWCCSLFLITANASWFLRSQAHLPRTLVLEIAAAALLVCAASFGLGRRARGAGFPARGQPGVGSENTTFTIYLAMTYASPLVALGPTFYVLWHNLWNSWQLHRHSGASGNRGPDREPALITTLGPHTLPR
jgi:BASS family bile acid:Na+ symporter